MTQERGGRTVGVIVPLAKEDLALVKRRARESYGGILALAFTLAAACSPKSDTGGAPAPALADASVSDTSADVLIDAPGDAGSLVFDVPSPGDAPRDAAVFVTDPKTCEEAASSKSYVGCDFWPTMAPNIVWSIFDFAAIVANAGDTEARINVTGPNGFTKTSIVGPNRLVKIFLPWVKELKGTDANSCGRGATPAVSVRAPKGAYHLVSTRPVTVYQFNALEYKGTGGPATKTWTGCPGDTDCVGPMGEHFGPIGCFSFTNDASLLLPSTAMTGNYRIAGQHGAPGVAPYMVLTGTQDDTEVTLSTGLRGKVNPGKGVSAIAAGSSGKLKLGAGDVVVLVGGSGTAFDHSGSLLQANKPVQVLTGAPCIQQPIGKQACDHIESTVFPAESLGKDYVVTVPTGPNGNLPGHIVRIFGNVDDTTLTYKPAAPKGAPKTINAGAVVDLGIVDKDFEVTGNNEFGVGTFMLGGELLDPTAPAGMQKGDPSQSMVVAVEQWRSKYVFLAPDDYDVSYVDVAAPTGTKLQLDGAAVTEAPTAIGATGFVVYRVKLAPGEVGAHTLVSDRPAGIQVMGYGLYTSYQYPGGLNLLPIAPAPIR